MSSFPNRCRGRQFSGPMEPWHVLRHEGGRHDFLDRLHRLATQVGQGKTPMAAAASALARCVSDTNFLRLAWDHLQRHGGEAPGPDGWRYSDFTEHGVRGICRQLRDDLRGGDYEPGPERVVHISKGPHRGKRPLALQSIFDRVVQRSCFTVLDPFLDPLFSDHSLGFRRRRGRFDALALAEWYFEVEGRAFWVTADVKDAFLNVPLSQLLQIVKKYLIDDTLVELVGRLVGGSKTSGLRQGGSLSPLLLNLYLHHHLDRKWKKKHPDIPLIRVADDLLLCCKTRSEAKQARAELAKFLLPAGMKLKGDEQADIRAMTKNEPAEWLGFRITRTKQNRLRVRIAEKAWDRLPKKLYLMHEKPDSPLRAGEMILAWLNEMGPCYKHENYEEVYARIIATAQELAFDELPAFEVVKERWQRAYALWRRLRHGRRIYLANPTPPPPAAGAEADVSET
ncbi:hypothetical protein AYO44_12850 [Planctomycetaceae bacterium SCGC AG-212-F19]|nr:hypothetical protein AYO44_12850 [Planctomycetaceae bacterium SCGC AG-212-F19]